MRKKIAEEAPSYEPAPSQGTDNPAELIQLAVRMPASLRDGIHALAKQRGCSTQELVNQILRAAVVEAGDPQLRIAARLFDEIRQELASVAESGAYERYTAAIEDPDLVDH